MQVQPILVDRFAALSDPTRFAIIDRLAGSELSVSEIAKPFALSQPTISNHIKVLERAGLIERRKDAQRRLCRLKPDGIAEVREWLERVAAEWAARLDRLAQYSMSSADPPV